MRRRVVWVETDCRHRLSSYWEDARTVSADIDRSGRQRCSTWYLYLYSRKSSLSVFVFRLSTRTSKARVGDIVLFRLLCDLAYFCVILACLWHLCTVLSLSSWSVELTGLRFISEPALDGYFLLLLRLILRIFELSKQQAGQYSATISSSSSLKGP